MVQHQEKLWSHLVKEVIRMIQLADKPAIASMIVRNVSDIVGHIVGEAPECLIDDTLSSELETIQCRMIELSGVCECSDSSLTFHTIYN